MHWENRIKELCARALSAKENEELEEVLTELRIALREHALQAENRFYSYPVLRRDPELITN